jgi:glycosyltransferase involved in cell wall biosynthesis
MQKVCLIIPFYNEEKRFHVEEFLHYYNISQKFCFCLVNDGSTDATSNLLAELQAGREERIIVINYPVNKGKAAAIQKGILESLNWYPFEYIGYLDADFSTPLNQMELLSRQMEKSPDLEFVFGSRVKLLGKNIHRKAARHYFGRIFSTLASIVLNLSVYDTQCGAKLIKSNLAREIFVEEFISPWLFDVELFARIIKIKGKEKGIQAMLEVPLDNWKHKESSKLKFKALLKVPVDLFRIKRKYHKYL